MEKEEENISKLSTEEKCCHKNWKARSAGYEDLIKIFNILDDEKSSEWSKYSNLVKKFPCDANAAAQEKGLQATLAYITNAPIAIGSRIVSEVMEGIVTKCVIALKSKSKDLAANVALMCVEIEKYEVVQEELMKGLDHKNPKTVAGCIAILQNCLAQFGPKIFNMKLVVKKILSLSEDRDKAVRDETKKLLVEFYRWIGPSFKIQLSTIKPATLQEIEGELMKLATEVAIQTRFLRSEQKIRETQNEPDGENGNDTEEIKTGVTTAPGIPGDPYGLLEPFDILSDLPKGFYQKCDDKKWQERKEALEKLETLLVANPKLDNGDYSDLVRRMKQMITKDPHIVVTTLAAKIITYLAKGLGKKFSPYAVQCLIGIFEKFKEKKASVVNTLREASDSCFAVAGLESIQEETLQALQNKNPAIKQEVSLFMGRCFSKTPSKVFCDKKIMNPIFVALTTNINVSDPNVRDAAAEALGIALKILGEKPLSAFLQDLDAMKLQKVKEFADKSDAQPFKETKTVKSASTSLNSSKPVKASSTSSSETNSATPKSEIKRDGKSSTFRIVKGKPAASISIEETVVIPNNSQNLPVNNCKSQRFADEAKQKILKWNFTSPRQEFVELLRELMSNAGMSKDLISNMFNVDFKFHLKALETLVSEFKTNGHLGALSNLDLILKWLAIRFFDTNPSVLTKSLDYIQMLLEDLEKSSYRMADVEAYSFVPYLILKLGDSKDNIRSSVHNIIKIISHMYSPQKVCGYMMDGLKSKNARQRVECLEELAFMIPNFGLKTCFSSPGTGLKDIAKQIADRDTAVRNSALNALVQAYFIDETKFYKLIGQLTPKDQSLLDERIKRAVKPKPQKQKVVESAVKSVEISKSPVKEVPSTEAPEEKLNTSYTVSKDSTKRAVTPFNFEEDENESVLLSLESHKVPAANSRVESPTIENETSKDLPTVEDLDEEVFDPTFTTTGNSNEITNPFLVNFDEIDDLFAAEDITITELKLLDTNIDDILHEAPILLPKCRTRTRSILSSRPSVKVPSKNSVEGLDFTISQTGNSEMQVVIQALMNLDVLIADPKFHEALSEKVDNILSMATLQFRRIHPALECLPSNVTDDVNQYFLCVLNTLKAIYKTRELSVRAQKENTKELLYYLLILITESNLSVLPDFKKIVKEMNLLVVPVIDTSDPVVIICSLVRLLNETTLYPNGTNNRVKPLILKCLWKLIKQMGIWAKESEQIQWDLEPILTEFYLFLNNHPFSTYIGQDEMPIKTIKTVMHSLIMTVGASKIAAQLVKMPKLQNSEGGAYIFKVVDRERQKPPLNLRRKSYVAVTDAGGGVSENSKNDNKAVTHISKASQENNTGTGLNT